MTSRYQWCAGAHPIWRSFFLYGVLCSAWMAGAGVARAQDPFEIHVLEYEDLQPGEFTAEVHTNYVGAGTTVGASGGTKVRITASGASGSLRPSEMT